MIEYQVRFIVKLDNRPPFSNKTKSAWCVTVSTSSILYANLYVAKPTRKQIRNDIKSAKKMGLN